MQRHSFYGPEIHLFVGRRSEDVTQSAKKDIGVKRLSAWLRALHIAFRKLFFGIGIFFLVETCQIVYDGNQSRVEKYLLATGTFLNRKSFNFKITSEPQYITYVIPLQLSRKPQNV